ncbi:MAG: redox-regulated ATPase YchF [Caldiserica bacterium]|nr:redox-regulated ATPase YchF [Caldisericota bacterium]
MQIGIVGLPNAGKSTIFNALSQGNARVEKFPFTTIEPNIAKVAVPDERLSKLKDFLGIGEGIPAEIEFMDIAGLIEGASKGEGMGNQFLSQIQTVDLILHVVRGFSNPDIPHRKGDLDIKGDIDIVETELILRDLDILQNAVNKLKAKENLPTKKLLEKIIEQLQQGIPLREIHLKTEEQQVLSGYGLLTSKPVVYVINMGEDKKEADFACSPELVQRNIPVLFLCGKIEEELSHFSESEREEFKEIMGLQKSGLQKLIKVCYDMLNLITFYTIARNKLHAWSLKNGATVIQAAEKIHSDMAKGFIKAEVINFDHMVGFNSYAEAKEKGRVRIAGKEYLVKDGDILYIHFRT